MDILKFTELEDMHIEDLRNHKDLVVEALDEQRKERNIIIGQIMFYQNEWEQNK